VAVIKFGLLRVKKLIVIKKNPVRMKSSVW